MRRNVLYILMFLLCSFWAINCNGTDVVDDPDVNKPDDEIVQPDDVEVEIPNEPPQFEWAKIIPEVVVEGEKYDLIFRIKVNDVNGTEDIRGVKLDLKNANDKVRTMFDDGDHEDDMIQDGIYGYVLKDFVTPTGVEKIDFRAQTADMAKKTAMINFSLPVKKKEITIELKPEDFEVKIMPESIEAETVSELSLSVKLSDPENLKYVTKIEADLSSLGLPELKTLIDDAMNADGIFRLDFLDFTAPEQAKRYDIQFIVTTKYDAQVFLMGSIIVTPKIILPNDPPKIVNQIAIPPKAIFGKKNRVVFTATVFDAEGLEDISSVFIDLSQIGIVEPIEMFDDGAHEDGEPGDGIYGVFIEDFEPAEIEGIFELVVTATDSKDQKATQNIEFLIEIPKNNTNDNSANLESDERKVAPEEVSKVFDPLYRYQNTTVYKNDKKGTTEIIIKDSNSWNPKIVGYKGFQEGGVKFAYPKEWEISRKHTFQKSKWVLDFEAGYIDIEMWPYQVGDNDTLKEMMIERRNELQKQYETEMNRVEFDQELRDYEGFLGVKAYRLNFYLFSKETKDIKEGETINHSLYLFNVLESTSQPGKPIYRTFKIEYWRITSKITADSWAPFVDNFKVE